MKTYVPDYYSVFRCIADRCRHSCCIGWEIDIDPESLARYQKTGGQIGARLKENIEVTDEGASFRLGADERCPLLNSNGLCDLMTECGEDSLCEICREHPRFRSFFDSRTEIGLGLCCEEAARLILMHEEKTTLILLCDDGEESDITDEEEAFFTFREKMFALLQDRAMPIRERMKGALELVGIPHEAILANDKHWSAVYRTLEVLDPAWIGRLCAWQVQSVQSALADSPAIAIALEQLAVYFLYRHLTDSLDDGRRGARVAFAILSCHVIASLAALGGGTLASLIDIARSYSAEIEYSTENADALLDEIENIVK